MEKIEKRVDRGETRTKLLEQAILQMKELLIRHEERLDETTKSATQDHEDFTFKLNALIELQSQNEREFRTSNKELSSSIRELRLSIKELVDSSTELRRASESQLTRIENLENTQK